VESLLPTDRRGRHGDAGFTMIELLVVVVVLGMLAAIVVFALGNMTSESWTAACDSDSKTVNLAAGVYLQQNTSVTQLTESDLTSGTGKSLSEWPKSTQYTIEIAGDGNALAGTMSDDSSPALIQDNDVVVQVGTHYFDATRDPLGACPSAGTTES
jgi:general secretion pathway protein G